jgi:lipopolysaccharide/colanic/teichoic acid biosynthesis glycosyltransferase
MTPKLLPQGVPLSKRLFDILLTVLGGIILLPFVLLLALAIFVSMGGPIIFRQKRPGLGGEPFNIYKFRSMRDIGDNDGQPLPDADRLTRLGRLLRSLSLDELPELWNVLRGEMSLVGPRPLLMQYLERYTPEQARRHEVLPGITGWAQINGRNALTWEDKFRYDLWYVENWSLWLDVKILMITLWKVIQREGISQEGHATAEEFMGNGEDSR